MRSIDLAALAGDMFNCVEARRDGTPKKDVPSFVHWVRVQNIDLVALTGDVLDYIEVMGDVILRRGVLTAVCRCERKVST